MGAAAPKLFRSFLAPPPSTRATTRTALPPTSAASRSHGLHCDVGAFEYQPFTLTSLPFIRR